MTQYTTVKVSIELRVPSYYADWGKKALVAYLNNQLMNKPDFYTDVKEKDIILIGKEIVSC